MSLLYVSATEVEVSADNEKKKPNFEKNVC